MFWEKAALRSAIIEWRDAQRLAAAALMNAAAVEALDAFNLSLAHVGFLEIFRESGTVAQLVDAAMYERVAPRLEQRLHESACGLRRIDSRLEPVALALPRMVRPAMPGNTPAPPERMPECDPATRPKQRPRWMPDLRDVPGVHARLRSMARTHIARVWLEEVGEPQPILSQIDAGLVCVAAEAKEIFG